MKSNLKSWEDVLPHAEFAYNHVKHSTTSMSPFKIVYGFESLTALDLLPLPLHEHVNMDVEKRAENMKKLHEDKSDVNPPTTQPTSPPPSPPSGPMTRARVKALHDKVNSILSSLDLGSTLDGLLLHTDTLCILRYESRELPQHLPRSVQEAADEATPSWSKDPGVSALKTGVSAWRSPESPAWTPPKTPASRKSSLECAPESRPESAPESPA